MGFLFPDKPRTYAPPSTPPAPTMLDRTPAPAPAPTTMPEVPAQSTAPATGGRTAVAVDLPGRSGSYAEQSLHSAGLAVDVDKFVKFPEAKKLAVRNAAERAGLSWGGTFSDPIHFYFDPIPGQDRTALINNFAEQVRLLKAKR
jgi:hypothetical protein